MTGAPETRTTDPGFRAYLRAALTRFPCVMETLA